MIKSFRQQVFRYRMPKTGLPGKIPWSVLWLVCKVSAKVFLFSFTFFRSGLALPVLAVWGVWRLREELQELQTKRQQELDWQFQECILSVAAGLKAGYCIENAFRESERDMEILFGKKSVIVSELREIYRGMSNNIPLEKLIRELSRRQDSDYIREFAEILNVAERTGGNLVEIIGNTAQILRGRMEAKAEIEDILSGKKLEGTIMKIIPFFLMAYIQLDNPSYFDPLYHNPLGVLLMSGCLAVYLLAVYLIEKILKAAAP